jgi:integrase
MARHSARDPRFWTDARIARSHEASRFCLGDCLYLDVTCTAQGVVSRRYFYRYLHAGKRHDMGLGSTALITLAEARAAVLEARRLRANGGAPIEQRRRAQAAARAELAKRTLFADCAEAYYAALGAGWSKGHRKQWQATIATYARPVIGQLSVNDVNTQLVLKVLGEMWEKTPVLAKKLQGWIEAIFDFATARGLRAQTDNPARWKGHLDKLLLRPSKIAKVKRQRALPWRDIPAFFAALKGDDSVVGRGLELIALTSVRKMEGLKALWGEFDLAQRLWVIPAARMKADRDHRVALSAAAVELLEEMRRRSGGNPLPQTYVFAARGGQALNNDMPRKLLKKLGYVDKMTVHGLRSSFRDWVDLATTFPAELAELALAHNVGTETERAYARSDRFEKRLKLADAWGNFCTGRSIRRRSSAPSFRRPRRPENNTHAHA